MNYRIYASGTLQKGDDQDWEITDPMIEVYILETGGEDLTEGVEKDIRERFDYGHCGCAHDCCGHRHGGVSSITKVWEGRYVVIVTSARNY